MKIKIELHLLNLFLLAQLTVAYDDGIKPCWDIRLSDPEAFCYDAIDYPMSTDVFYNSTTRDAAAHAEYLILKDKWDKGGKGSPSNHCLAIARDFYCFNNFPRC